MENADSLGLWFCDDKKKSDNFASPPEKQA